MGIIGHDSLCIDQYKHNPKKQNKLVTCTGDPSEQSELNSIWSIYDQCVGAMVSENNSPLPSRSRPTKLSPSSSSLSSLLSSTNNSSTTKSRLMCQSNTTGMKTMANSRVHLVDSFCVLQLLWLALVLVATSVDAYRMMPGSASLSSTSKSSMSGADQPVVMMFGSRLATSGAQRMPIDATDTPMIVSDSGEHPAANRKLSQLRPSSYQQGQKETELPMNPNEVYSGTSGNEDETRRVVFSVENDDDIDSISTIKDQDDSNFPKRAKWTNLQGGWGKRNNNWNKMSAAWGKRQSPVGVNGWNNLSGMWGKKRAKWNELSGMWGKRAWNDMSGGWGKRKRSSSPHWNKLRGMWGKRSVPQAKISRSSTTPLAAVLPPVDRKSNQISKLNKSSTGTATTTGAA